MEMKLKGRRFITIEEMQAELQRVLDILTEKDFKEAFQNGRDVRTSVYMREGTVSLVVAANRPVSSVIFYSASLEYFGYTVIIMTEWH
jgi:glutamyl-tRNA reductase